MSYIASAGIVLDWPKSYSRRLLVATIIKNSDDESDLRLLHARGGAEDALIVHRLEPKRLGADV